MARVVKSSCNGCLLSCDLLWKDKLAAASVGGFLRYWQLLGTLLGHTILHMKTGKV